MIRLKKINIFILFVFISISFGSFSTLNKGQKNEIPNMEELKDIIFAAAERGDFDIVKNLITKHPEMMNVKRDGGWTLLHIAFNSRELIEYLIKNGADIHAKSDGGWTPLHSQAYYGHLAGVELLIEHGSDLEAKHAYGMTPLVNSIKWDRIEIVKILVEKGANVNSTNILGRSPLILSSINGYQQLVEVLLKYDADVSLTDDHYKRTALHFGALNGHLSVVEELLKKDSDINKKDLSGKTACDYARQYGHDKVAQLLRASGDKGKISSDRFGFSPFLTKHLNQGEAYAWFLGRIGYAVKTRNNFIIFSYFVSGSLPEEPLLANGHINLNEIKDIKTTVFAGGPAYWHHNPERYHEWQKKHKNMTFIYSFEDKIGRNPSYFNDVEGPKYVYIPAKEKKALGDMKIESIPVSRGTGFLIEVDGLVIFHGGDLLLMNESQRDSYNQTIDYLKESGQRIDLLILSSNFLYGRIISINLEGVDLAVRTLKPRAYLTMGADSTEFVFEDVLKKLEKYKDRINIFCPEHRGDMFTLKN